MTVSPALHRHAPSPSRFVRGALVLVATVGCLAGAAGPPATPLGGICTSFEPARALHPFAENPSSMEAVELLAVFVTDADCGPLVIPEPGA